MSWIARTSDDGVHAMAERVTRDVLGWRTGAETAAAADEMMQPSAAALAAPDADVWYTAHGESTGMYRSGAVAVFDPCTEMWAAWRLVGALQAAGARFTLSNTAAEFTLESSGAPLSSVRVAQTPVPAIAEAAWFAWRALHGQSARRAPDGGIAANGGHTETMRDKIQRVTGYALPNSGNGNDAAFGLIVHMAQNGFDLVMRDGTTAFVHEGSARAKAETNQDAVSIFRAATAAVEAAVVVRLNEGITADTLHELASKNARSPPPPTAAQPLLVAAHEASAAATTASTLLKTAAAAGLMRCVVYTLDTTSYASVAALLAGNADTLRGVAALLRGACAAAGLRVAVRGNGAAFELVASWAHAAGAPASAVQTAALLSLQQEQRQRSEKRQRKNDDDSVDDVDDDDDNVI